MKAERIIGTVRNMFSGLGRTSNPETAGADQAKEQKGEIARRLGLEKEMVIARSSRPYIGPTRAI